MRLLLSFVVAAQLTTVSQLGWMTGCWAAAGKEKGSEEHWLAPAGGTLLGISRTVKKGVTVAHEFMQIREMGGGIVFVASPSGQKETSFTLVDWGSRRIVFQNAEHDFPQRVSYSRRGERLLGRIEGTINGKEKSVDFPMTRVSCR